MTSKSIFELGKSSPAAKACIPLEFEPTVPLISKNKGWIAEYWYFFTEISDQAIYVPQYYLALEIPGGNSIKMERLSEDVCCLGAAPELIDNEYYNKQNLYLEECAKLMQKSDPTSEEILALQRLWLDCLPAKLKTVLKDRSAFPSYRECSEIKSEYIPESLIDVLKLEMAKAIQKGDASEICRIQNEISRLLNK